MYIKEIKKKNKYSDKIFVYHRLVESYKTPKGPRQRIRKHFSRMVLSNVSMATKDNKTIYIRNTSKPNDFQKKIFDKLNLNGKIINKKITIVE